MKSSKTFCFRSFIPASCHFLPYSPPPRILGTAYIPPFSKNGITFMLNVGNTLILKPPYPYSNVGLLPSNLISFL
ncbi:MAG: hypothetical protein BWX61_01416 [Bacteroidetes bacterium ADurb.Bin035]|nr:MAG: hypothetical protein BWX61_01416 [Bacteroidetes bacterium ADurb.Bin035]